MRILSVLLVSAAVAGSLAAQNAAPPAPPKTNLKVGDMAPDFTLEGIETQVFGISADNTPSQKAFAEKLNLTFPLLSDFAKRQVAADYGVLIADRGFANRATFVIDKEGRIQHIEEGSAAIDPTGAETACARIHHKQTE